MNRLAGEAPILVAAAIIERERKLLITQRYEGATLGGFWEFPGGKCRNGEPLDRCLHRELMEELGVQVTIRQQERIVTHRYDYGEVELHFYRCTLTQGEPAPLSGQALRWVAPNELADYPFPPANRPLIDELRRQG